jgi:NADPH:quinone reductase-like Zn-dependent oxidoreductase
MDVCIPKNNKTPEIQDFGRSLSIALAGTSLIEQTYFLPYSAIVANSLVRKELGLNRKPIHEQVVVVVGANSGIGRVTALRFAERGAKVVVAGRSQPALTKLVNEIERW